MPVQRFRLGALALVLSVAAAVAAACQVLVPGDVPDFRCSTAEPSSCPVGQVCDLTRGLCAFPPPDGGPRVDSGAPDARADAAGPAGMGAACARDTDCQSGICGTNAILTPSIANSKQVCTKSCCTSADCATGFVCFATGTGGNYCVAGASAARTPSPSGKGPGALCSASTECRSGLCEQGRCLDTCCGDGACVEGSVCRLMAVESPPGVRHDAWACSAPVDGGRDLGESCGQRSDCKNDNCTTISLAGPVKRCNPTCCSTADCAGFGANNICLSATANSDSIKFCGLQRDAGPSVFAEGESCTTSTGTDCQTRYCDQDLRKCLKVCCFDGDCGSGKRCRPTSTGILRCVPN